MPMQRYQLIEFLSSEILTRSSCSGPLIVGIDGIDLSGKTLLSEELSKKLESLGKKPILVHEDQFVNPKAIRNQQGMWSAKGFYEDFFDHNSLAQKILYPLKCGENVDIVIDCLNFSKDVYDSSIHYRISAENIVIVEGLFLLRPELAKFFDMVIRLKISAKTVMERALVRDVPSLGSKNFVTKHYRLQPIPAQTIYERLCNPNNRADIILDNTDASNPVIVNIPS